VRKMSEKKKPIVIKKGQFLYENIYLFSISHLY